MALKKLEIAGGAALYGEIRIQGSKNAALPVLAACMLGDGPCVIENCPQIGDVEDTLVILRELGCEVKREGGTVTVDGSASDRYVIEGKTAVRIRSSILFLGALLGKMRKAALPGPGGCAIGSRPIDLHLETLERLGVIFAQSGQRDEAEGGRYISACGAGMHGGTVRLRFPSVGATENLILAFVQQKGETIRIERAAQEPEIDELIRFLNLRGGSVRRERDGSIFVQGVERLGPVTHCMQADRIVAGTYLMAAAVTGGCIRIRNFPHGTLEAPLALLERMGGRICPMGEMLLFDMPVRPGAAGEVETRPYPGFPTDLQSPLMAVCAVASGRSRIRETIFENRFRTAQELVRMGAVITVDGNCAQIEGKQRLHGARVSVPDLRGGAALVLAALQAEGETEILQTEFIERGYEDICRDLLSLGALIRHADG